MSGVASGPVQLLYGAKRVACCERYRANYGRCFFNCGQVSRAGLAIYQRIGVSDARRIEQALRDLPTSWGGR
jgi:hypothetical protein